MVILFYIIELQTCTTEFYLSKVGNTFQAQIVFNK